MKTALMLGLSVALLSGTALAHDGHHHGKKIHGKWHYTSKSKAGPHASAAHMHNGVKYYSTDKKHMNKSKWTHRKAHTSTIGFEDHDKFAN